MPNAWIYSVLEKASIKKDGGFLIPFTVLVEKGQVVAAHHSTVYDRKDPSNLVLRKLFVQNPSALGAHLGVKDERVEFMDTHRPSEVQRIATTFVEKISPINRSAESVASLVVEFLTPQQTLNLIIRGESDNAPLHLIATPSEIEAVMEKDQKMKPKAIGGSKPNQSESNNLFHASSVAMRNGILQQFPQPENKADHSTAILFTWKAERPVSKVFPTPGSYEDGAVKWSCVAKRNVNEVLDHRLYPYQRGVTVDADAGGFSEKVPLTDEESQRIGKASEFLIQKLSNGGVGRPIIEAKFVFRFVRGELYFYYAPLVRRVDDILESRVRFVVPKQFQQRASFAVRSKGNHVGEEDLLQTPRMDGSLDITGGGSPQRNKRSTVSPSRRESIPVKIRFLDDRGMTALQRQQERREAERIAKSAPKLSPFPDAPREHPETDPKMSHAIKKHNDVAYAKALLEALDGKKTIPLGTLATRLKLSQKELHYLEALRKSHEGAQPHDVLVMRAHGATVATASNSVIRNTTKTSNTPSGGGNRSQSTENRNSGNNYNKKALADFNDLRGGEKRKKDTSTLWPNRTDQQYSQSPSPIRSNNGSSPSTSPSRSMPRHAPLPTSGSPRAPRDSLPLPIKAPTNRSTSLTFVEGEGTVQALVGFASSNSKVRSHHRTSSETSNSTSFPIRTKAGEADLLESTSTSLASPFSPRKAIHDHIADAYSALLTKRKTAANRRLPQQTGTLSLIGALSVEGDTPDPREFLTFLFSEYPMPAAWPKTSSASTPSWAELAAAASNVADFTDTLSYAVRSRALVMPSSAVHAAPRRNGAGGEFANPMLPPLGLTYASASNGSLYPASLASPLLFMQSTNPTHSPSTVLGNSQPFTAINSSSNAYPVSNSIASFAAAGSAVMLAKGRHHRHGSAGKKSGLSGIESISIFSLPCPLRGDPIGDPSTGLGQLVNNLICQFVSSLEMVSLGLVLKAEGDDADTAGANSASTSIRGGSGSRRRNNDEPDWASAARACIIANGIPISEDTALIDAFPCVDGLLFRTKTARDEAHIRASVECSHFVIGCALANLHSMAGPVPPTGITDQAVCSPLASPVDTFPLLLLTNEPVAPGAVDFQISRFLQTELPEALLALLIHDNKQ